MTPKPCPSSYVHLLPCSMRSTFGANKYVDWTSTWIVMVCWTWCDYSKNQQKNWIEKNSLSSITYCLVKFLESNAKPTIQHHQTTDIIITLEFSCFVFFCFMAATTAAFVCWFGYFLVKVFVFLRIHLHFSIHCQYMYSSVIRPYFDTLWIF